LIADQLEALKVPISSLKPLEGNPRKGDVKAVARSLKRFGQRKPIVVDSEGTVLAGNHTLAAALELGWTEIAAVAFADDPATGRAFALADNRTAELGSYDAQALAAMVAEVHAADPSLLMEASFEESEVSALLASLNGHGESEDVPERPTEPETRLGDLYLLGAHRLLCGDATDADAVEKLLAGTVPNLMVTDPPYGVEYRAQWRADAAERGALSYAARRTKELPNDDRADWGEALSLFPGNVLYAWSADLRSRQVTTYIEDAGFELRAQIIWVKPHFPIGQGHYHFRHEPCWYAVRKGRDAAWCGDRKQTTVWEEALDANVEGGHSTQKPVALMRRPLENHEGAVYDPFVGSGTTLVAAEQAGRACFAMDVDPGYCDVAVARWERYSGQKAERA
jgi:DNA modification methylase